MPSLLSPKADVPGSYEEVLKHILRPTWDQSERFALYMSSAHSWYKFLPDREYEFFLFLDPFAAMNQEYMRSLFANESIQNSWRPSSYPLYASEHDLALFGFWNYYRPGPSSRYPQINLSPGRTVSVPSEWAQEGLALLDPFVHTNPPFAYFKCERFSIERWPSESFIERIGMCLEERLARRPRRLKEALEAQIPSGFRNALEPVMRGPASCEHFWLDDRWKQKLHSLQVPREHWSPLCKYFALLRHERVVRAFLKGARAPARYSADFFAMALAEERVLQLTRLTDAMERFLRRCALPPH